MNTSELIGPALDRAVAKARRLVTVEVDGVLHLVNTRGQPSTNFNPSVNWSQGGPIIERDMIHLTRQYGKWVAKMYMDDGVVSAKDSEPLIAAMRCYVASKLGDEVEIPEELK